MSELSDELLVAYVDGQLAPKQAQAVDKVLAQDDVLSKRVSALQAAHKRLEAAFDAILAGAEADLAAHPVSRPRGFFVSWSALLQASLATAGMVLAAVMLLAGLGWPLKAPEIVWRDSAAVDMEPVGALPRDWREEVARAQALIGRESLEIGAESQTNAELARFQLARMIGPNLLVPELGAEGLRFARAQVLRFEGKPVAQLLYLDAHGAPFALYAKAGEANEEGAFKRYGAIGAVSFAHDGIAYLIAGEADEPSLVRLADAVRRKENSSGPEAPASATVPPVPNPKPKP